MFEMTNNFYENGNGIFTDSDSEDFPAPQQRSQQYNNRSQRSNTSSNGTSSDSNSGSGSSLSNSDQDQVTDDENVLLSQSSPSPLGSSDELSASEQNDHDDNNHDNYLDPDLYCLRRSNRQKDKASVTSEQDSEELTFTTDEDVHDDTSSDDDYGESFSSNKPLHNKRKPIQRQSISKPRRTILYETEEEKEEEEEASSDEDWGTTPKPKKKKLSKRRSKIGTNNTGAISLSDYSRHSTRSRNVTNYNEDNAGLWGLSDEEVGASYTPAQAEEDESETIESILDHRKKEGEEQEKDIPEKNMEFLVKWKTWSHLHDTWDTYEYLHAFKGFRKLDNYIKNRIYDEQNFRQHSETTKEEIEQQDINISRRREEIEDWRTVERVTAVRGSPSDLEYYVKWKRLHYDQCTWEDAEVISANNQTEIDEFLDREQNVHIPHRSVSYPKGSRPKFQSLKTQPSFINGGQLRDYQLHGVNWMYWLWCKNENGILADEMGLGKTVQTISFLNHLYHSYQLYGPFLIVVPLSTSENWMNEFKQWAPQMNIICYLGNRPAREAIRNTEFYVSGTKRLKFNVIVTTYEIVLKDKDILSNVQWQYLAVDEAHRLKNADSQLYEVLLKFNTKNRLLITGTPLQNNIKELLALIHFLMPDMDLSKYTTFDIDVEDASQEENIKALHTSIKRIMLRRLKKDVEKSLPNKSERILRVEMSELQKKFYKNILAKNFAVLSGGTDNKKQWLNIAIELKKASNHPFLFPDAETISTSRITQLKGLIENSGKMILLDKLLTRLKNDGHRVLIFSQLVMMLDILSDYMSLRGYPSQRLDGSMKAEDRNKAVDHYNAPDSPDFAFLLSTRAGGMGINLVSADTVIIFDSDWNPQNDLQAMSRAHRIGQTKSVNVYRFVTKGTMEEDIIERAKRKMVLEYCIIKQMDTSGATLLAEQHATLKTPSGKTRDLPFNKEELSAILKFGAQNMFKSTENNEQLNDMDLDDILARAETTETTTDEGSIALGSAEFLNQFKITDYGGTADDLSWDDIIPDSERIKVEEQQRLDDQAALLDRAAKKNRIIYSENAADEEDEEDPDSVNKRRKKASSSNGVSSSSKKRHGGKAGEMSERDRRAIVRAVLKYGDIESRYEEAVSDSDLAQKEKVLVLTYFKDLIDECRAKVKEQVLANNREYRKDDVTEEMLLKELRHTKQKAILFTWKEIQSVNAGQILQRHHDMKILARRLNGMGDVCKFRVSLVAKRVQGWSCSWGQKEDAMLLVGVHKHGFGSWPAIQIDSPLGLGDKFFIGHDGGEKSPKSTHLVRRAEQMLKILADEEKLIHEKTDSSSGFKKGPRSKQQKRPSANSIISTSTTTAAASPIKHTHSSTTAVKPPKSIASSSENRHSSSVSSSNHKKRKSHSSSESPRSSKRHEKEDRVSEKAYESYDEDVAYSSMRLVKHHLVRLRDDSQRKEGSQKADIIKDCINKIGQHIEKEVFSCKHDGKKLQRDLWIYTTNFWPGSNVTFKDVMNVYEKVKMAVGTGTATAKERNSSDSNRHTSSSSHQRHSSPSTTKRKSSPSNGSSSHHRHESSKSSHEKNHNGSSSSGKKSSSTSHSRSHSNHRPYRDKRRHDDEKHSTSRSSSKHRRSSSTHRDDDYHRHHDRDRDRDHRH